MTDYRDVFNGANWITDDDFANRPVKFLFHKQLQGSDDGVEPAPQNRHILFRKKFTLSEKEIKSACVHITADDYYHLYVNGVFAGQGPAPGYPQSYRYNTIDLTGFLHPGENLIAVHTLYQGLINRVWVSGDNRHGLLFSLYVNGKRAVVSDETSLTHLHTGFTAMGTFGYLTQFAERYDSRCAEDAFFLPEFDDGAWQNAKIRRDDDHKVRPQETAMLVFETVAPVQTRNVTGDGEDGVLYDFGAMYVGYFRLSARGGEGQKLVLRFGQELTGDGRVRFDMRCNCRYEEEWILSGGDDVLREFDYKSFRYVEVLGTENAKLHGAALEARHSPFELRVGINPAFSHVANPREAELLQKIWDICVRSQKYGVQEVIQDCMDREKGFYLGDGCYSVLTNYVLTGNDAMTRKLIDDAFESAFITEGLVTCEDCGFMQEIAEYPLILVDLILWHYRLSGDAAYLRSNYAKSLRVLEAYRRDYEKNGDGILYDLDKWCLVEWPKNYQDGYDVDIREGKVCHEPHVSICAYYINAICAMNKIAELLGLPAYRDEKPLIRRFYDVFYKPEEHVFRDGMNTEHVSYIGNIFPFAFGLIPDDGFQEAFGRMLKAHGLAGTSFFCGFLLLRGLARRGDVDAVRACLCEPGTYARMLSEGATTTFEGWGKDAKWNTSLFHLTLTFGALFMADIDTKGLFT